MKVVAAIASGVLATAIGVTATYFVMTKSLGYHQEPEKTFWDDIVEKQKGGGPGQDRGKADKGGPRGNGKGRPSGGDKGED